MKRTHSFVIAGALGGTVLAALKLAREAAGDVPVVKQILGSAINILELADKCDRNHEAMLALAEKAAVLAQRITDVTSTRIVGEDIENSLRRLDAFVLRPATPISHALKQRPSIFLDIHTYIAQEALAKRARRFYRTLFVSPVYTQQLVAALENEVQGFLVRSHTKPRGYLDSRCAWISLSSQQLSLRVSTRRTMGRSATSTFEGLLVNGMFDRTTLWLHTPPRMWTDNLWSFAT
ncbi:hypothetical protein EXIGLDRAFT_699144 [Exidia glandulosa HHB12029]|uniref:Uncharacterized protein n=1 Tax=Exidia glandulosa HHB12029 TaxID=1314781 RepID=A0A165Q888_EXIGL|nr:hypothetical protein EXIGLDRAFT_699144 [Exidia glandulosa HHB12029]